MTRKMVLLSFGIAVPVLWAIIYSSGILGILHPNPKCEVKGKKQQAHYLKLSLRKMFLEFYFLFPNFPLGN